MVLGLAAVVAILAGWRRGAFLTAIGVVGLIVGLWVGLQLAPVIIGALGGSTWSTATVRAFIASVVVLVCGAVLFGIASTIGEVVRRRLRKGVARGADAVGGAAVGLVAWAAVVWLLAGFVQTTAILPLTQAASSSRIVSALNSIAPIPSSSVLSTLDDALGTAGLPRVFEGPELIRPVGPPDAAVPAAVQNASGSVVKVVSMAPKCGTASSGSGWVIAPGRVVTNAHVVAGGNQIGVLAPGGTTLPARLVAFDPERDLAVLDVPGLQAAPLQEGSPLAPGDTAYAAGYPGGGPYVISPARVREVMNATGSDIYQQGTVTREIYSLRGQVRPGNSGGPLFNSDGQVVGIVFARSVTDADTGYALTLAEAQPVLAQAGASQAVASGGCAVE